MNGSEETYSCRIEPFVSDLIGCFWSGFGSFETQRRKKKNQMAASLKAENSLTLLGK